eukprot:scaffold853_cov386-Prasinococcus_capsulatus_cf.AAC.24
MFIPPRATIGRALTKTPLSSRPLRPPLAPSRPKRGARWPVWPKISGATVRGGGKPRGGCMKTNTNSQVTLTTINKQSYCIVLRNAPSSAAAAAPAGRACANERAQSRRLPRRHSRAGRSAPGWSRCCPATRLRDISGPAVRCLHHSRTGSLASRRSLV